MNYSRKSMPRKLIAYWRYLWGNIYQHIFPQPFRIIPPVTAKWEQSADDIALDILTAQIASTPTELIPPQFACELCNEHFYLVTHLKKLDGAPAEIRFLRRLHNATENLQQVMANYGIEYRDLTGQDYHEGRLDFTNIAPAEIDTALTTAKIVICEYPAIFLHGKLIQPARGIVARPI